MHLFVVYGYQGAEEDSEKLILTEKLLSAAAEFNIGRWAAEVSCPCSCQHVWPAVVGLAPRERVQQLTAEVPMPSLCGRDRRGGQVGPA